jgi:hypothetical protein
MKYLRKVRLTFNGGLVLNPGGIGVHELKIGFNVSKGISGEANTAKIEIWNLNESHRNSVGKELDQIILEAGYIPPIGPSNVGVIFTGNLRDVEHRREGVDIKTTISCGDGDKALRSATISKTWPKGTDVETVLNDIFTELEKEGIERGEWKMPEGVQAYKRPLSACGGCARELNYLGRSNKFYWSIQNNKMEIIPSDGHLSDAPAIITPRTGMIDTPTITDNGVKVSCLMDPTIAPGRLALIQSETLEMNAEGGMYRVSQATYTGDNRDGDFKVEIHGEALKGGKVDEGSL